MKKGRYASKLQQISTALISGQQVKIGQQQKKYEAKLVQNTQILKTGQIPDKTVKLFQKTNQSKDQVFPKTSQTPGGGTVGLFLKKNPANDFPSTPLFSIKNTNTIPTPTPNDPKNNLRTSPEKPINNLFGKTQSKPADNTGFGVGMFQLATKKQQVKELKNEKQSLQKLIQEKKNLQKQLQNLRGLQGDKQMFMAEKRSLQSQIARINQQKTDMLSQNVKIKKSLSQKQTVNAQILKQINSLRQNINKYSQSTKTLQDQRHALLQLQAEEKRKNQQISQQLRLTKAQLAKTQAKVVNIQKQKNKIKSDFDRQKSNKQSQINKLTADLKKAQQNLKKLPKDENLKDLLDEKTRQIQRLTQNLQQKKNLTQKQIADSIKRIEQKQLQLDRFTQKSIQLQRTVQQTKKKLDQATKAAKSFKGFTLQFKKGHNPTFKDIPGQFDSQDFQQQKKPLQQWLRHYGFKNLLDFNYAFVNMDQTMYEQSTAIDKLISIFNNFFRMQCNNLKSLQLQAVYEHKKLQDQKKKKNNNNNNNNPSFQMNSSSNQNSGSGRANQRNSGGSSGGSGTGNASGGSGTGNASGAGGSGAPQPGPQGIGTMNYQPGNFSKYAVLRQKQQQKGVKLVKDIIKQALISHLQKLKQLDDYQKKKKKQADALQRDLLVIFDDDKETLYNFITKPVQTYLKFAKFNDLKAWIEQFVRLIDFFKEYSIVDGQLFRWSNFDFDKKLSTETHYYVPIRYHQGAYAVIQKHKKQEIMVSFLKQGVFQSKQKMAQVSPQDQKRILAMVQQYLQAKQIKFQSRKVSQMLSQMTKL